MATLEDGREFSLLWLNMQGEVIDIESGKTLTTYEDSVPAFMQTDQAPRLFKLYFGGNTRPTPTDFISLPMIANAYRNGHGHPPPF